jgi:hypothetical protein
VRQAGEVDGTADHGHAHTSIKTQQQIDPQDERNTTPILLAGLEKLDNVLSKLK